VCCCGALAAGPTTKRLLLETAAVAGHRVRRRHRGGGGRGRRAWPDGFTASGLLAEGPADGRAAFRHPLTQEAAYADIPVVPPPPPLCTGRWPPRWPAATRAPALDRGRITWPPGDFGPAREALIAAARGSTTRCTPTVMAARTACGRRSSHWPAGRAGGLPAGRYRPAGRCAEMCSEYADAVMLLRELADGYERRVATTARWPGCHRRLALAHELRGQWESALTARGSGGPRRSRPRGSRPRAGRRPAWPWPRTCGRPPVFSAALAYPGRRPRPMPGPAAAADLRLRASRACAANVLARARARPGKGSPPLREALDSALAQSLPDTTARAAASGWADAIEHSR